MDIFSILLISLTIFFWGIWGLIAKIGIAHFGKYQYIFVSYLISLIIFSGFLLTEQNGKAMFSKNLIYPILGGFSTAIAVIALFSAIERAPVSIVYPLSALYPAVTIILAIIFLGERLNLIHGIGIVFALAAGFLLGKR